MLEILLLATFVLLLAALATFSEAFPKTFPYRTTGTPYGSCGKQSPDPQHRTQNIHVGSFLRLSFNSLRHCVCRRANLCHTSRLGPAHSEPAFGQAFAFTNREDTTVFPSDSKMLRLIGAGGVCSASVLGVRPLGGLNFQWPTSNFNQNEAVKQHG